MKWLLNVIMLSDWLKNLGLFIQPMRSKAKTKINRKLQVFAIDSGWFIVVFSPVVIGRSNYLIWYWFFDSRLKTALYNLLTEILSYLLANDGSTAYKH